MLYFSLQYYEFLKANPNGAIFHNVDSEEDFFSKIKNAHNKLVVVAFMTKACGECRIILPHLDAFAVKYKWRIDVIKVDVNILREMVKQHFHILTMPTFVFFKNRRVVERLVGAHTNSIERTIKKFS